MDGQIKDLVELETTIGNSTQNESLESLLNDITNQIENLGEVYDKNDYFQTFFNEHLLLENDFSSIFDSSIYSDLTDEDKNIIDTFTFRILELYYSNFGIEIENTSLRFLYMLYQIFVLHLPQYMVYYIIGLSSELNTDIEHENYTFESILKKEMGDKGDTLTQDEKIDTFLNYIIETSIFQDYLFEMMLYISMENIVLELLLIEYENDRLSFISPFFNSKLKKIILSENLYIPLREQYIKISNNIKI